MQSTLIQSALVEFVVLALLIAAALVGIYKIAKLRKENGNLWDQVDLLKRTQANAMRLSDQYQEQVLQAASKTRWWYDKAYKHRAERVKLEHFTAGILKELAHREVRPLSHLTDDQLAAVVREELERRVTNAILAEYATGFTEEGNPAHKVASKVGGAAFRVVDKAKRGKLVDLIGF